MGILLHTTEFQRIFNSMRQETHPKLAIPKSENSVGKSSILEFSNSEYGVIAQLGEHRVCNAGVVGSNPSGSNDVKSIKSIS